MKLFHYLLLAVLGVLLLFGCEPDNAVEKAEAPKLLSTNPQNGASGLKGTSLSLVITMDQNVKVLSADMKRVTVSGNATVASVSAYNADVTVKLESLEGGET